MIHTLHPTSHRAFIVLATALASLWLAGAAAGASPSSDAVVSCDEFLPAKAPVNGAPVGPERCLMQARIVADTAWPEVTTVLGGSGRRYHRLEIGVTGTLAGYVVREGPRVVEFTSAPDVMFVQSGNTARPIEAVVRYEAEKGSGLTLLWPEDTSSWNGKLYVTVHGTGRSFRNGTLKAWDRNFDPAKPLSDLTKFEEVMLLKGYAVAVTRRNSEMATPGDYTVTLRDGTTLDGRNASEAPEVILAFTKLAHNLLRTRVGREPARTYWYGKSSGARLGLLLNYNGRLNRDADGSPIIDGMLADDPGGGLWLPVVVRNGKDVLFASAEERARFVPAIEVVHLLYNNERNDPVIEGVSTNFLINKRIRARMLREKGLTGRYRYYELRGISHSGGETLTDQRAGDVEIIPLWHLMDALIDMLDTWVERGVAPPPDRADAPALGDTDGDGNVDREALSLPDTACPLGEHYQFPPSRGMNGVGDTAFAPFDGQGVEPLDGRSLAGGEEWFQQIAFADMNHNGSRDERETVTQAWRRIGLLSRSETFSKARYESCVDATVDRLVAERFLTEPVARAYRQRTRDKPVPGWVK